MNKAADIDYKVLQDRITEIYGILETDPSIEYMKELIEEVEIITATLLAEYERTKPGGKNLVEVKLP